MKKAFMVVMVIMAMIIFAGCGLGNDKTEAKTEIKKENEYSYEYGEDVIFRANDEWFRCKEIISITEIQPNGDSLTMTIKEQLIDDEIALWQNVANGELLMEHYDPEIGRYFTAMQTRY